MSGQGEWIWSGVSGREESGVQNPGVLGRCDVCYSFARWAYMLAKQTRSQGRRSCHGKQRGPGTEPRAPGWVREFDMFLCAAGALIMRWISWEGHSRGGREPKGSKSILGRKPCNLKSYKPAASCSSSPRFLQEKRWATTCSAPA